MEPYRVWLEDAALRAQEQGGDEKELVSLTINFLKAELESEVAVPLTRQIVSRKNLLHGEVLALINYLEGEVSRFSIPMEGYKRAGRPQKNGLRIPGERLKVGW
jgi:hypothetical protein